MRKLFSLFVLAFLTFTLIQPGKIFADETSAQLFFSSRSGSYSSGTTFDVPIYLNTNGVSVKTIELHVSFDPRKVSIVKPSSDISIIGVWNDPPSYSNTEGKAIFNGGIPNGITTSSGLVTSIKFKAIESGVATIKIGEDSKIIANDGSEKSILKQFDRAEFTITPQLAEGTKVFSATHPFDDRWYNNKNPTIGWEKEPGVIGFSYVLDNMPYTIPDNTIISSSTATSYEDLNDGLWYFHIKAKKKNGWGATTHYLIRIDTEPPADFVPSHETLTATVVNPTLVSFSTYDALSGVDHYEVGVIEKDSTKLASPVFVQTESPYQVPINLTGNVRVIVRAFDRAGNVRETSTDFRVVFSLTKFLTENSKVVVGITVITLVMILVLLWHILIGHHFFRHARHVMEVIRKENEDEHNHMV